MLFLIQKYIEKEILQYDFDIEQEKQRNYAYLTIDHIIDHLGSKLFENTDDIKVRKLIVNTFIRKNDKLLITYNFSDATSTHKINTETVRETERQIDSALKIHSGSYILPSGAPIRA